MIYGYYTVPLKTVRGSELPEEIQVEDDADFRCGIKLAHLMFIPFFPLGKSWVMRKYDNSYEISEEAEQLLDTLYGTPKTPWYSFSGLILIGLVFLYFQVQEMMDSRAERAYMEGIKKEETDGKIKGLTNPLVSDYYALKSPGGQYYAAKVDSASVDKVWLRCVVNDKGYGSNDKNKIVSKYVLDRDKFFTYPVAKSDLMKSFKDKKALLKIKGLASGQPLTLVDLYNLDISKRVATLSIQDAQTENEVKKLLSKLTETTSVDSSMALLDSSSKRFLLEVVKVAKNKDAFTMKKFIDAATYPTVTYGLVMYAHYAYLPAVGNDKAKSDEDLLKGFSLFSKLLGVGLWTTSDKIKQLDVRSVVLEGKNIALARLSLNSNILETETPISFNVTMNKEGGQWKLNLPSTYAYTRNQILKVGSVMGTISYKKRVRDDLQKLYPNITFAEALK